MCSIPITSIPLYIMYLIFTSVFYVGELLGHSLFFYVNLSKMSTATKSLGTSPPPPLLPMLRAWKVDHWFNFLNSTTTIVGLHLSISSFSFKTGEFLSHGVNIFFMKSGWSILCQTYLIHQYFCYIKSLKSNISKLTYDNLDRYRKV